MKPENIEARKAKRKHEAVVSVLMYTLLELATGAIFAFITLAPDLPGWLVVLFRILAGMCVASTIPAFVLLKGRFKEIEGGELDAAAEY